MKGEFPAARPEAPSRMTECRDFYREAPGWFGG